MTGYFPKIFTAIIFCVLIFFAETLWAQKSTVTADPATWELGLLRSGEVATREIFITAPGKQAVEISGLVQTCDCLSGEISRQNNAGGASAAVLVRFDSTGLLLGDFDKDILVELSKPAGMVLKIRAVGSVMAADRETALVEIFGSSYDNSLSAAKALADDVRHRFGSAVEVPDVVDIDDFRNGYPKLKAYEDKLGRTGQGPIWMVLDGAQYFSGQQEINQAIRMLEKSFIPEAPKTAPTPRAGVSGAPSVEDEPQLPTVYFFYSKNCPTCLAPKEAVDRIAAKYAGRISVKYFDTALDENRNKFFAARKQLGFQATKMLLAVVGRQALVGEQEIVAKIGPAVSALLKSGKREPLDLSGEWQNPAREYSPLMIISLGLADGINPCVFATMIFFVSMMAMLKKPRREIMMIAAGFTAAVFVTYFLVGLMLFSFISAIESFSVLRSGFFYLIFGLTTLFAVLSFYDAFIYLLTGASGKVVLQLPAALKARIHSVLRDNLKSRGLIWAALIMGFLVTLIETVCTGQVYVPALQLIKLGGGEMLSALLRLFLYNVAFIIPLLGVFGLTLYGVKSETLAGISKKYLPLTKIILGVLFICLAILLWFGHRPSVGI